MVINASCIGYAMARRKNSRKRTTRRKKPVFNLTNAAQTLIIANGVSMGVFRVDLPTFFGFAQNFQGGYNAGNNSNELTLKEIWARMRGGDGGMSKTWRDAGGIPAVLQSNIKNQLPMILGVTIGVPIAFKFGKQLLSKPIINPINRTLKLAGIKGVKV